MKLIDLTCNKCGAQLKVNADLKKYMCQYCGNEMLIDDEVKHHKLDNGFDFGYQAEMGRLKAQEDLIRMAKEKEDQENRLFAKLIGIPILSVLLLAVSLIGANALGAKLSHNTTNYSSIDYETNNKKSEQNKQKTNAETENKNDEEITLSGRLGSAMATTCKLRIDEKITSEECRNLQSEIISLEKELLSDSSLNDNSTFISKVEKIEEKLNQLEK